MVTDLKTVEEQMKKLTRNGGRVTALKNWRGCLTSPPPPNPQFPEHPLWPRQPLPKWAHLPHLGMSGSGLTARRGVVAKPMCPLDRTTGCPESSQNTECVSKGISGKTSHLNW